MLNSHFYRKAHCSWMFMDVQENVYKMAIMTLSSKLYLQRTTFVSIKKPPVSQLPFLGNCHGDEKEGLGRGGQGRTAGCCFLAEILLSIHQGHKQAARRCAPKFLWLLLPSTRQVYFPRSPRCVARAGFIPMGAVRHSWEILRHILHPEITLTSFNI